MKQFYVVEIQQYQDGSYGHIVHFTYDENPQQAQLKAESKYHEVLAAAAVSNLPSHAAIMFTAEGFPMMNHCYKHAAQTLQPAPEPAAEPEEESAE